MGPRLAVLDMVGTTVVSGPEVPDAFQEAFRRVGVSLPEAAVNRVRGRAKTEAVADLVSSYLQHVSDPAEVCREVHADFRSILRSRYEAGAVPIPGAEIAVSELMERGLHVVLTTGLDRDTANGLIRGLGWESLGLAGVISGDDVVRGRPAPDLIHAAMELVSVNDPARVLVVGDTVSDLEAAARAEVGWAVGVLTGAHTQEQLSGVTHTIILESIARVPRWLQDTGALD